MDKAKELDKYIRAKHTQEECIGFIDGFEVAEKRVKERHSIAEMSLTQQLEQDQRIKELKIALKDSNRLINKLSLGDVVYSGEINSTVTRNEQLLSK